MPDTIAAVATGGQTAAIGILRLSGPDAIAVVDKVFRPLAGPPMAEREDRKLVYGRLVEEKSGVTLDHCLCTVSRGPGSYTGEDTAELQCHGSPMVLAMGLECLFRAGARQARPGEFTRRAFLNGRLDLTQAEAVIDLIEAETPAAACCAAGQLEGALGRRIQEVYDALTDICAHFHAVLDYPDEDIEPFSLARYAGVLARAEGELQALGESYRRGRTLNAGIPTVILGRPNAGKSSLLNALVGYDRAIVTDLPGTTRDTVTVRANLGKTVLELTDTAGIRETADPVERLGVERALAAGREAELALVLVDPGDPEPEDWAILRSVQHVPRIILVLTKADLYPMEGAILSTGGLRTDEVVSLSAKTGKGLDVLANAVETCFPLPERAWRGEILTNARQAEAAARARESLSAAREAMAAGITPDAVLSEVECAMAALGELTGRTVREDVTDRIFSRFCVGK